MKRSKKYNKKFPKYILLRGREFYKGEDGKYHVWGKDFLYKYRGFNTNVHSFRII